MDKFLNIVSPHLSNFVSATQKENLDGSDSTASTVSSIFGFIVLFFAVYLALKCRSNPAAHSMFLNVLGAVCCSPCYVFYRLVSPC